MLRWLISAMLLTVASSQAKEVRITASGTANTVYSWSVDRCEDDYIPDAPARAFRRADGQIALIATHRKNWTMVGPEFSSLKSVCRSILDSDGEPPGTGSLWIEATYTRDGRHVAALVSQDLTQVVKKAGCDPRGVPGRCWLNNILAAQSDDMGASFHLLKSEARVVAALTQKYEDNFGSRVGVFTTSNIFEKDGFYFMIAYAQAEGRQSPGNCLFRTADPFRPELWRAWDGAAFSLEMRATENATGCSRLTGLVGEVRSVSYIKKAAEWVAVFTSRQKLAGDSEPVPGFYFATSKDLIFWTGMSRIMPAPTRPREQNMTHFWLYPSMLDPNTVSRNFDVVDGDTASLFFTVSHLANGKGTLNRDLVYVPLVIDYD